MAKSKNFNATEDLNTAEEFYKFGNYYYNLAADFEDHNEPQTRIDATWSAASINYWKALTLGSNEAPLSLFKCFAQGVGVKKDADIAALMYGTALKLTPEDCAKIPVTSKPVIAKSMQPRIDALVKLVKTTHDHLPAKGVDTDVVLDQMTKFNNAIKLPSGKLIQSCFTEDSTAALSSGGPSSSQHNASYETCPDTSFSSEKDVALGGSTKLHVCCEIM